MMYRPFITLDEVLPSGSQKQDHLPFPARALCTNSARSLAKLTQEQMHRGASNIWALVAGAHTGASLLIVNIWQLRNERKRLLESDSSKSSEIMAVTERIEAFMQDAQVLLDSLEYYAPRWEVIGGYL